VLNHLFSSPKDLRIANELLEWANTYLMTENPEIKRPAGSQAVCPYVGASIKGNSLYMAFHPEVTEAREAHIEAIMAKYLDEFPQVAPFDSGTSLTKALLVVFPELPEQSSDVLDLVHQRIKSRFVRNGLMVAQFHKNCGVNCIYNRAFKVNISPYPLMAIRQMHIHDIVFLEGEADWFNEYDARFGDRLYAETESRISYLLNRYLDAKRRFGA
jgi:hypothetical protein